MLVYSSKRFECPNMRTESMKKRELGWDEQGMRSIMRDAMSSIIKVEQKEIVVLDAGFCCLYTLEIDNLGYRPTSIVSMLYIAT